MRDGKAAPIQLRQRGPDALLRSQPRPCQIKFVIAKAWHFLIWINWFDPTGHDPACYKHRIEIMAFDYGLPAELFMRKPKVRPQWPGYRRFATAAEAIRFAVEDFPDLSKLGAWMWVGDKRFNREQIRLLYESSAYPLRRRTPIAAQHRKQVATSRKPNG